MSRSGLRYPPRQFLQLLRAVDEAVQTVAALDESPEQNFVRKHARAAMETEGVSFRDATFRVFSSKPNTYGNGVNLAVLQAHGRRRRILRTSSSHGTATRTGRKPAVPPPTSNWHKTSQPSLSRSTRSSPMSTTSSAAAVISARREG